MPRVDNPAVAAVVAQLARGSRSPVKDGTLSPALQAYSYDRHGGNFQVAPGPEKMDRKHPVTSGGAPGGPQVPIMAVGPSGGPRTRPGPMEGRDFGPDRVSHTRGEKGQADGEAVIDMLMAMGLPQPVIMQILQEMGLVR